MRKPHEKSVILLQILVAFFTILNLASSCKAEEIISDQEFIKNARNVFWQCKGISPDFGVIGSVMKNGTQYVYFQKRNGCLISPSGWYLAICDRLSNGGTVCTESYEVPHAFVTKMN